jgi:TetR/AcrR family transcriptional regulator, ethionamide resistance regulator
MPAMASVTRPPQPSRQNRRDALERRLLEAAEQLVNEGTSFTELSVERLAARAGISRSTFYVHVQDKSDLVLRLMRSVITEVREASGIWWTTAAEAERTDLRASIEAIVDVYRRHPAAFAIIVETSTYDAAVSAELHTLMQSIVDGTRDAIERGQEAGTMRPVALPETAAVLTWMVERAGYQLVRSGDPTNDPTTVDVLTDIIWTTLYQPAT